MQLLVENGADPNFEGSWGIQEGTALDYLKAKGDEILTKAFNDSYTKKSLKGKIFIIPTGCIRCIRNVGYVDLITLVSI